MDKKYYTAKDLAQLITYIEKRPKPFEERSARQLLEGYEKENKDKLEDGDPKYLSNKKPSYYSENTICEFLNDRTSGHPFTPQDVSEHMNIINLIETERNRAGEAEDQEEESRTRFSELEMMIKQRDNLIKKNGTQDEIQKLKNEIDEFQRQHGIYIEGTEYDYYDDPYSYENMVQPNKVLQNARRLKLEIILEVILEQNGYSFDEKEFYADLIEVAEAEAYIDDTEITPFDILVKKEKINNPKKYYIKEID